MKAADIAKLNRLRSRHGRRKLDLVLCEGVRGCLEALRHSLELLDFSVFTDSLPEGARIAEIRQLARGSGRPVYQVSSSVFAEFATTLNSQGVICVLRRPPPLASELPCLDPFVLILDRLGDPGNVGTIVRTAWAAGLRELWITEGTTDPFGPKCIRAGMGGQFALRIRQFASLTELSASLSNHGFDLLWCSVPRRGVDCYSSRFSLAGSGLVIGNEAHGVEVPRDCRVQVGEVTIPMPGSAESLNAAQAATILMFEAVRRGILPVS